MADPYLDTLIAGRYRLEKQLGRGGFGAVYLARNIQLRGRQVVVKILLDQDDTTGWFRAKFSQEVEALARIHHPGVVSVVDAGVLESGEPYMVQEFVAGSTLADQIRPGGMELPRVSGIVLQIGKALAEVHRNGVLHRDLKPGNVMLQMVEGGGEHVTLIDFGIASVAEDGPHSEQKTKVAGTFAYMAPEQFDGRPTAASDAYALGVIAFEMLAGATPSSGKPMFELMLMQREGNWPRISQLRPSVPVAAEEAIRAVLSYRAEDRPSAAEFAARFAQALLAPPAAAREESLEQQTAPVPAPSRRPGWTWMALLAVAAALSTGLWLTLRPSGMDRNLPPKESQKLPSPGQAEERLAYWLTVKPRPLAGRPPVAPFILARERTFATGDQIYFEFQPAQNGWLYIINQAPILRDGAPVYVMLFPSPSANAGSPRVDPKSGPLRIPEQKAFEFQGQGGVERVWVIWSDRPLPAFDSLPAGQDSLPLDARRRILEVLGNYEQSKPLALVDELDLRTRLSGRPGDLLIHRIDLYAQPERK